MSRADLFGDAGDSTGMTLRGSRFLVFAVAILLLVSGSVVATTSLSLIWTDTTGGDGRDSANAVAQAADSTLLVAGTIETGSGADAFLERRARNGSVIWQRTYGDDGIESVLDVQALPDGGALLLGTRTPPIGDRDAMLWRVDPNGTVRWSQTYGGPGDETAYSIVQTDAGYAFVGFSAAPGSRGIDAWLVGITESGSTRWEQTFDIGRVAAGYDLLTTDHGLVIAGVTTSGGTVLQGGDGWLAAVNPDGSLRWSKRLGGAGGQSLRGVVESENGFTAAGFTTTGDDVASAWVVRTNGEGTLQWNRTYGNSSITVAADIVPTSEGYLLLGEGAPDGDFDLQLRRISASGTPIATRSFGDAGDQGGADLLLLDNRAVAVGVTTASGGSESDGLILSVTAPPGVSTETVEWRSVAGGLTIVYAIALTFVLALASSRP